MAIDYFIAGCLTVKRLVRRILGGGQDAHLDRLNVAASLLNLGLQRLKLDGDELRLVPVGPPAAPNDRGVEWHDQHHILETLQLPARLAQLTLHAHQFLRNLGLAGDSGHHTAHAGVRPVTWSIHRGRSFAVC